MRSAELIGVLQGMDLLPDPVDGVQATYLRRGVAKQVAASGPVRCAPAGAPIGN